MDSAEAWKTINTHKKSRLFFYTFISGEKYFENLPIFNNFCIATDDAKLIDTFRSKRNEQSYFRSYCKNIKFFSDRLNSILVSVLTPLV